MCLVLVCLREFVVCFSGLAGVVRLRVLVVFGAGVVFSVCAMYSSSV